MLNIEKYKDEIKKVFFKCYYGKNPSNYLETIGEAIMEVAISNSDCNTSFEEVLCWLCAECKEPPLTDEEHDYLKVVFKPFWQDIAYVKKDNDSDGEYLIIKFKKGRLIDEEAFSPYWREGTFFKGMEVGKTYTLEELGITYESRKEE